MVALGAASIWRLNVAMLTLLATTQELSTNSITQRQPVRNVHISVGTVRHMQRSGGCACSPQRCYPIWNTQFPPKNLHRLWDSNTIAECLSELRGATPYACISTCRSLPNERPNARSACTLLIIETRLPSSTSTSDNETNQKRGVKRPLFLQISVSPIALLQFSCHLLISLVFAVLLGCD